MRMTLTACLALGALFCSGQAAPILMDGLFDDWTGTQTLADPPAAEAGIDVLQLWVTNDADYLYVSVEFDTELDLTDNLVAHNLFLYVDADTDASTGFGIQADFGSELGVDFNSLFAYYDVVPASTVSFSDLGFHPAPTVTSNRFEMAFRRDAVPDGVNPLFPQNTIRLMVRETLGGDQIPNAGTFFEYTFDDTVLPTPSPIGLEAPAGNNFRVCAYNVLANGLVNASRQPAFERICSAIDAEVFMFSECGSTSTTQVKSLLDSWLPTGTAEGWYTIKDEDLITASIWPILDSWPGIDSQFPVLLDIDPALGVPTVVINCHLACCANDAGRQEEVDEMMAWMEDAKTPGGAVDLDLNTPIIYGGDLNLVGYAQQLTTLLTGEIVDTGTFGTASPPDWDNSPWTDVVPRHTDANLTYTWRDDGDGYPAGRLDFMIYSDAVLNLEQGYVIQTEEMPAERLTPYGLLSSDTGTASDHFPMVGDFSQVGLTDSDTDGLPDINDNCPDIPNPDQADWNANGTGDVCEDSDGDGLLDSEELLTYGTDPGNMDSDGDGLTDGLEAEVGTTDPNLADTNDNGCADGLEALGQCGPGCEGDLDGDGIIGTGDLLSILGAFGNTCD